MDRAKEARPEILKEMLDAIDTAAYAFDRDRRIIYVNKAAASMLDTSDPGSGLGAAEINHFDRNLYLDEAGRVLPYPKGSAVEIALEGVETKNLILEHRDLKNRTQRWISISCKPMYNKDGSFEYGILSYRDVSRRENEQRKLQFLIESTKILSVTMDLHERLQKKAALAVPSLADWCAIDIRNTDGTIERVALVHRDPKSLAYLQEFEKKYPEQPGASVPERVIDSGKAEFIPNITDELIGKMPGLSAQHRADILKLGLTSFMVVPIGTSERMLGAMTLAYAESGRTYTEKDLSFFTEFGNHLSVTLENARLYESIKQRDIAKDQFLAVLSHELRNPLAPIKSALELLHMIGPNAEILEQVHIIEHQFDHMTRLLSDLLDSTRFLQGKIKLDTATFDAVPLMSRIIRSVWPLAEKAGISLNVSIADEKVQLAADPTRIEQALSNLLHNAIKFTPKGGSIFIELAHDTEKANIRVRDTGFGITKEEMARIFEPYYQSERVSAGNRGLGIGLRLVSDIVRIHGGTIEASSPGRDQGSEFVITLPLAKETTGT